jgi:hypothetical protein
MKERLTIPFFLYHLKNEENISYLKCQIFNRQ